PGFWLYHRDYKGCADSHALGAEMSCGVHGDRAPPRPLSGAFWLYHRDSNWAQSSHALGAGMSGVARRRPPRSRAAGDRSEVVGLAPRLQRAAFSPRSRSRDAYRTPASALTDTRFASFRAHSPAR